MSKNQGPVEEARKLNLKVFVISPIGVKGSASRKRADMALHYIIRPAVRAALGVDPKRADEDTRPGVITNHIMQDLNDADLVIANLTDLNANVMYELGLAHALSKPVIHMADHQTALPFDNNQYRTIFFDTDDPASHSAAQVDLAEHIRQTQEAEYEPVNPFTLAVKITSMTGKGTQISDAALLGEMQASLAYLGEEVKSIWTQIILNQNSPPPAEWTNALAGFGKSNPHPSPLVRLFENSIGSNLTVGATIIPSQLSTQPGQDAPFEIVKTYEGKWPST